VGRFDANRGVMGHRETDREPDARSFDQERFHAGEDHHRGRALVRTPYPYATEPKPPYASRAQRAAWESGARGTIAQLPGAFGGAERTPRNYVRSDARIRENVCERLGFSDEVDPRDCEVLVSRGEVTLRGQVPERAMRMGAERIASEVPGVRDVLNELRVSRS
jgi:hypothetical protein